MQEEFLIQLQKLSNPTLDNIFIFITNLGGELFYVLALTVVYWCINRKVGAKMFTILIFSVFGNSVLKEIFSTQRPFKIKRINALYSKSAPGYSFPSGHTQGTTTFWFYMMRKIRNNIVYLIGVFVIILVGFSRLYLRVHWPIDVIGGIFFGIIFAFIGEYFINKISPLKYNVINTLIFSILIPNVLLIFFMSETNVKLISLITGALFGYFIEENYIKFNVKTTKFKQGVKLIIGLLILMLIRTILKYIFLDNIMFDYIRYFVIGISTTLFIPYLFIKLNLSKKAPF